MCFSPEKQFSKEDEIMINKRSKIEDPPENEIDFDIESVKPV